MKALLVPKEEVEPVRKRLLDEGYFDTQRKLISDVTVFQVPVTDVPPGGFGYPVIEQEHVQFYQSVHTLADLMEPHLDGGELEMLPRGWQILGDIAVVSLHSDLYGVRGRLGWALLELYPNCKSVYLDKGIEGELRRPKRELIAVRDGVAEPSLTVHTENGCRFRMDVTRVMFSKGNLKERIRMADYGGGEVVVDMFAGIGYFTIPMAVHSRPEKIIAIELNPESYNFLVENARLNRVGDVVEPVFGDCAEVTPESAADRVVMGYVGHTHRYLEYGIRALKSGGILHYHDAVPADMIPAIVVDRIEGVAAVLGRRVEVLGWQRVKKYSPGIWHVVVDAGIF